VTSLRRLVLLVVALGLGLQLAARALLDGAGPVVTHAGPLLDLPHVVLVLGLLAMAAAGDLASVPVRRGEVTEELTLYESAVVVAVLLLPARDALWVPVAALALTAVLQRRPPLKAVFNVANHAAATALLVLVVHQVSGPDHGLDLRTVGALLIGLLVFSSANLLALSLVLRLLGEADARQILADGPASRCHRHRHGRHGRQRGDGPPPPHRPCCRSRWSRPSLWSTPSVPRRSRSEQRQRSVRFLALSQILAGRVDPDELLPEFLAQCRQAWGPRWRWPSSSPGSSPGTAPG
jgi:hypothetical protein